MNRSKMLLRSLFVATAVAGGWIWWRNTPRGAKNKTYPDPHSFIIYPPTTISVTRLPDNKLMLKWNLSANVVNVYARPLRADSPAAELLTPLTNQQELIVEHLTADTRYLFELELADGQILTTAERILPLEGGVNFRDIGGYQTADGRSTRWGKLYRSGDLSRLTEADIAYLQQLGVRLVCDLRTTAETIKYQNRLPHHPTLNYLHTPIYEREDAMSHLIATLILRRSQLEKVWLEGIYIKRFVEDGARSFGRALTLIADERNYPAVIHCTAGKDRTGITIALLLSVLGVPEELIIADYTLSNLYFNEILSGVEADAERLAIFGIQTPDLFPFLTAQAQIMQQTLHYINHTYGSIEQYLLQKAAVSPATLETLRHHLLSQKH
ncbi:MAG: tyrosine-protein phosphatase [Anaerolineales bacterium]|nr:tyrosine-protein phosphatase [Anaerolineales bacterium]